MWLGILTRRLIGGEQRNSDKAESDSTNGAEDVTVRFVDKARNLPRLKIQPKDNSVR